MPNNGEVMVILPNAERPALTAAIKATGAPVELREPRGGRGYRTGNDTVAVVCTATTRADMLPFWMAWRKARGDMP